jgi:hypothetical protein
MNAPARSRLEEIDRRLDQLGRRLRWRDGWNLAQRTLWLPALASLAIQLIGRTWPVEHLLYWTLAPLAAWLVGITAYAALRPLSRQRIARQIDLELELKERLSTALQLYSVSELAGGADLPRAAFEPGLVELQQQDALKISRSLQPAQALPLRWLRRHLAAAFLLAGLAAVMVWLPNPMEGVIQERQEIAQEAQQQAERIEALGEEVAESTEISPELKEELLRQLAELARQLRENPGDKA